MAGGMRGGGLGRRVDDPLDLHSVRKSSKQCEAEADKVSSEAENSIAANKSKFRSDAREENRPEIWSTIMAALTSRGIAEPVAMRMVHGGNRPSTQSSKARIWGHWCDWRTQEGEPPIPRDAITIVPIINFLGSRRTAGGDYISWGYMRMFIATVKRTLALIGKLRSDVSDEATFDQFKSSMRAEKPDTAKYASFFDLDDLLSHISNMYEDSPWHDLSHDTKGLGKLRSMSIVNLKISGLYRSDDLLHFCSGSLLLDKQASSGSRWGHLEAEGPRGKYPSFVIVHLSSTKTGPRENKLEAYPEEPALCPVYALWCYTRIVGKLDCSPHDPEGCIFVSNNRQTDSSGKIHRRITSADTIANDTLKVMADAGIDTALFQAHSLRGTAASKHLEDGADERDVMARGGWASSSVFNAFYARTKHKEITIGRLRQARGDKELEAAPRELAAHEESGGLDCDPQSRTVSAPDCDPQPRKYELGLHDRDASGHRLEIPNANEKDGSVRFCFSCWASDFKTLIWCRKCNKHLHRRHFLEPSEAEEDFLENGWLCDECIQ